MSSLPWRDLVLSSLPPPPPGRMKGNLFDIWKTTELSPLFSLPGNSYLFIIIENKKLFVRMLRSVGGGVAARSYIGQASSSCLHVARSLMMFHSPRGTVSYWCSMSKKPSPEDWTVYPSKMYRCRQGILSFKLVQPTWGVIERYAGRRSLMS